MPGPLCGTDEELKAKQAARRAEMLAEVEREKGPSVGKRFEAWFYDVLAGGLVLLMAALPIVAVVAMALFALGAVLGSVGVLVRWAVALWQWMF